MSKKTNPIIIGIFVMSAIFIAVVAVMVLGAANFSKSEKAVCYFKDSVNGLVLGAPVKFKGVVVGKVTDIVVNVSDKDPVNSAIAVFISISPDLLMLKNGSYSSVSDFLKEQRDQGMRAELNFQSAVTGMLYIELDYDAKKGDSYTLYGLNSDVVEIPIQDSALGEVARKIEGMITNISEIDFKQTFANIDNLLNTVNKKLNDLDSEQINARTLALLENLDKTLREGNIPGTLRHLDNLLVDTQTFLAGTSKNLNNFDSNIEQTLLRVNELLESADTFISPNSSFRYELSVLLKNIGDASMSIKVLADFIERNPNAIITGKFKPGK